jgi:pSer/pThr/pTyr-binding forkhead associated (FHA) protein
LPVAVVFLLRTVVLILLWGFVIAAVVAVRHDVFGVRPARQRPAKVRDPRLAKPPKPAKPPRRAAANTAPPSRVAIVDGPLSGTSVALSSLPITIGRAEDSTIVINDDYVSHRHARLVPRGTTWLIEDLGSTNGTLLDGKKLTTPTEVRSGSQIRIGKAVLELQA